ncbi:MAG: endonuclease V, partial [Armatimonadota bacterium]
MSLSCDDTDVRAARMHYRELHSWTVSVHEAAKIQEALNSQVSLIDGFAEIRSIGGIDVSAPIPSSVGCAGVAILSFEDLSLVEFRYAKKELTWPYIPGFLSFREVPVIIAALEKVECIPDVIVVDGQGIAHPRRFGIAAHLGVLLNAPTI